MKRTFHTDRKAMVKAVSEALGIPSKYLGAPTMSYQIGSINIDRNGTLTTENKEEGEKAMAALKEQGIIPEEGPVENTAEQAADLPPIDSLEISIPRDKMTEDQLNNLKKLVEAKSTLIRHAFQTENTDLTVTDDKTSESSARWSGSRSGSPQRRRKSTTRSMPSAVSFCGLG